MTKTASKTIYIACASDDLKRKMAWNYGERNEPNLCRHWLWYAEYRKRAVLVEKLKSWREYSSAFFLHRVRTPFFENSKIMKYFFGHTQPPFKVSRETNFKWFCVCVCAGIWHSFIATAFGFVFFFHLNMNRSSDFPIHSHSRCGGSCTESQCHWDWGKKPWRGEKIDFEYRIFFRLPQCTT